MIKNRLFAPICLGVIVMVVFCMDKSCIQAWPTTGGVENDLQVKVDVPLQEGNAPLQGKKTLLVDKEEKEEILRERVSAKPLDQRLPKDVDQVASHLHKLDLDLEALKQHWLQLLGLGQEPPSSGGPQKVPAFMRAVYALYESQAARDHLYHYLSKDNIADQERTVRALLPQHGKF